MALQAIKKTNISEQVFNQLKQQLLDGTWTPGQKLPSENELCAAFGVSRITVRQALQKLTVLGLLETRLGEGSFVREFTPGHYMNEMIPAMYLGASSVEEIFEFRVIMEVEVAGIAARKATDADIERLSQSLKRMTDIRGDINAYTKEDFHFHMILAEISGNSLVIHLMGLLTDVLEAAIQNVTRTIGEDSGLKYHNLLLEAIKIHNYDMAKTVMREHVEIALKNFKATSALSE
ncbi:FadR/GntR family transcriptional regulator [Clostridium minihomine]|uniref:FadR/GntR family transcriptional regulator n=1 Tax=Clostridium minihomine TaxID=2045012 RepID=UPI000C7708E7|nr:FadR/GntR family transcriptional regulator [Clostridium minihomine]